MTVTSVELGSYTREINKFPAIIRNEPLKCIFLALNQPIDDLPIPL
jgi:hypothetical protein